MAKDLSKLLVVDVESTAWEGDPPPGEVSEIIEIGVAVLDTTKLQVTGGESILVRPARSKVSEFCTKLTTLTQAQVDAGIPFRDACSVLRDKYNAKNCAWASYGDYDRTMFEKMCGPGWPEELRGQYPFGKSHLNIKLLFALYRRLSKEAGMEEALRMVGIPLKGVHHRGFDDAKNLAPLLAYLVTRLRN
jgi:inhibitor of KinA sporulation pathway (predicted exonuclease)